MEDSLYQTDNPRDITFETTQREKKVEFFERPLKFRHKKASPFDCHLCCGKEHGTKEEFHFHSS